MPDLQREQRASERRDYDFDLRFRYVEGDCSYFGTGRARNLTSDALCFESDQDVPSGALLEVTIACGLNETQNSPVELLIDGGLLRQDKRLAVVDIRNARLRPCGTRSFYQPELPGGLLDVTA